jgi:xylan 1,4-beta-xylosidase
VNACRVTKPSFISKRLRNLAAFKFVLVFSLVTNLGAPVSAQSTEPSNTVIVVDGNAPAHPFPHFWEEMFGSGRAILSLRDNYRRDLRDVKHITNFEYIRFHAIFHDEVGVYDEDAQGNPIYNFSYVDQIYDGLLANGVKPFVELSFMPNKLAARNVLHAFWYKQNISPPKDYAKWDGLITAFAKHLIDRYGIAEVSQWYFEVWNEPNLDFWAGEPKQETYWELYDHTVRALKAVDQRLIVGGPSTAQSAWVDAFIQHCAANHVPVDFVSTHVYGDDPVDKVLGTNEPVSRDKLVCRAVNKVSQQIKSSAMPRLPLIYSEYNASFSNNPDITDSTFEGPWLADTIRQCDGLTQMMSYWDFSDVFEEQGVIKQPFYGGFGIVAVDDIPKPAFNAFEVLHKLGDQRIKLDSDIALVTRKSDGTIVLAVWNYAPPGDTGAAKTISLRFKNISAKQALISRVDHEHGDVRVAYQKMGSPRYPTPAQIQELQRAAQLPAPELQEVTNGELMVTLPPQGLAVIELHW